MPVPPHLHALLDDASAARSAQADLDQAVRDHRAHRQAWYGAVVGPLVVGDAALPLLARRLGSERPPGTPADPTWDDGPLEVVVTVSGGAGAVEPAVLWATREPGLALRGLQVTMRESDAGDLSPNARRIVAAVDALVASGALDEDVPVHVEPPALSGPEPTASWLSALDELATMDHRLTLRADGTIGAVPSSGQLAACIDAALDRELRFRCAGAHRALRHPEPVAATEQPGFLNLLLATRAGLHGASRDEMARLLEETDAQVLVADEAELVSARRWCTSFDTPDVSASLRDLVDLGRLDAAGPRPERGPGAADRGSSAG